MLRYPLTTIFSKTVTTSSSSSVNFNLPFYDVDGLVAKFTAQSFSTFGLGAAPTLDVYLQTSDDGGTTFYDVAAFKSITGTITAANAAWVSLPVNIGDGKFISSAQASSTATSTVIGLPVLGNIMRLAYNFTNAGTIVGNINWSLSVLANNASGGQY